MRLVATCARIMDSVKWAPIIECRMTAKTEVYVVVGESFFKESSALRAASQHVAMFKDTDLRPWNDVNTYQPVSSHA